MNEANVSIRTVDYTSALKRKEIPSHTVTQMNLEDIILRKVSQIQTDNYCMTPLVGDT